MSDQPKPAGFHISPANLTGIAEAIAFIVTAVLAFLGQGHTAIEVGGIGAALHGIGHGLGTH